MKIIKESKEKLPIDFITQFVSKGWEEVGNLKASIDGIKKEFAGTKNVEDILQDLVDAYLIAIGQMELHLDKKDYVELPDKEELKEALTGSSPELAEPIEAKKFEDENKTEIFTELPDYDVEVEQKGDKIEIELEPKDDEWPEPDMSNISDIEDAKAALATGAISNENTIVNNKVEDEISAEMPVPEVVKNEIKSEKPVVVDDFMDVEFPDVEVDEETDAKIRAWKDRQNA